MTDHAREKEEQSADPRPLTEDQTPKDPPVRVELPKPRVQGFDRLLKKLEEILK